MMPPPTAADHGSKRGVAGALSGPALLLDRHADHVAPLGPAAVVVADVGVAQQLVQHEPGMAAALADAAVGDDVLVRRDPLAAVQLLQFGRALERAVLGHGPRPGDVLGAG